MNIIDRKLMNSFYARYFICFDITEEIKAGKDYFTLIHEYMPELNEESNRYLSTELSEYGYKDDEDGKEYVCFEFSKLIKSIDSKDMIGLDVEKMKEELKEQVEETVTLHDVDNNEIVFDFFEISFISGIVEFVV